MKDTYAFILQQVKNGNINKSIAIDLVTSIRNNFEARINNDIAIIGMAGRFPEADDLYEFWNNLKSARNSIRDLPLERKKDISSYIKATGTAPETVHYKRAGYLNRIDIFDHEYFGISKKEAELMDPSHRLFLEVAINAIEDAGISLDAVKQSKTGVYAGFSSDFGTEYKKMICRIESMDGFASTGNIHSILCGRVSYLLDLTGPSVVVDTACSSYLSALNQACSDIKSGICEKALVGSVKITSPIGLREEIDLGVEALEGICYPFDGNSEGIANGEGAGCIVIKSLQKAHEDGDRIYAVIKGQMLNQDGKSISLTAPSSSAQKELISAAAKRAGVKLGSISYIEAHGTGTKLGDPIEIRGIKEAFLTETKREQFCGIGSVKANIGHLDCAAGVASVIKCILQLVNKKTVPSINFEQPNQSIDFLESPIYVCDGVRDWTTNSGEPLRCGISSFSVCGTNSHLILEEYNAAKRALNSAKDRAHHILCISARSKTSFINIVKKYIERIAEEDIYLPDLCYTSNSCRKHYEYRAAIIFSSVGELADKLEEIKITAAGSKTKGIYFGVHKLEASRLIEDDYSLTEASIKQLNMEVRELTEKYINNEMKDLDIAKEICNKYVKGAKVDWGRIYEKHEHQIIAIPLYQFDKTRNWIDIHSVRSPNNIDESTETEKDSQAVVLGNSHVTQTEQHIADIWKKLLGSEVIHLDDCFFDLGGNSLIAIKFEIEMKKKSYEVSFKALKENETIRKLARYIDKLPADHPPKKEQSPLDSIEKKLKPFNDIYFKDCFYNSLFPIIQYMGKSIMPFLLNDFAVYSCTENKLDAKYITVMDIKTLFEKENIKCDMFHSKDKILDYMKKSLSENKIIILFVDCYYESCRKDTYKKQHWPHTLLIYGIDDTNNKFKVIEHMNKYNLDYKHQLIPFEEVEEAHLNYFISFNPVTAFNTIFSFETHYEVTGGQQEQFEETARSIISEGFCELSKGMESLKGYLNYFNSLIINKEAFMAELNDLIQACNHIINIKRVEQYKYVRLESLKGVEELYESIIDEWDGIRKILAYCSYSEEYIEEQVMELKDKMKGIYVSEMKLLTSIKGI